MQPIIYDTTDKYKGTNDLYNTNGFGFLTKCAEFLTTMEKNGAYNFTAKIKSTDKLIKYIKLGAYIKAKVNNSDKPQLFYITKIEADKYGDLTISGEHVSRLFFQNGVLPMYNNFSESVSPVRILNDLYTSGENELWFKTYPYTFFTVQSNIVRKKEYSLGYNTAVKFESIFNDETEGLLVTFGGELIFNNFSINYQLPAAGHSDYRIAFGTNVSSYKQVASFESYYTHVVPYARCETTDGKEVIVTANAIYSTGISRSIKNVYLFDCTSKIKKYTVDPASGKNYNDVRDALRQQTATYMYGNEQTPESISITVNLEEELAKMYALKLYDYVTIVMPDGTELNKKISKTVYDSVTEKYKEITIGNLEMSMSDLLKIQRRFKK